jgi:hypothetical protein
MIAGADRRRAWLAFSWPSGRPEKPKLLCGESRWWAPPPIWLKGVNRPHPCCSTKTVVSGENSPFSLGEISNHITTRADMTSNALADKLAGAVAAAKQREQLTKPLLNGKAVYAHGGLQASAPSPSSSSVG